MNQATSTNCIFPVINFTQVKDKVLNWVSRFNTFCFLDNHQYQGTPHTMECLVAAGIAESVTADTGNALTQLQSFISPGGKWFFGHLGYDLKNEIENLHSLHPDHIRFPDLFFFRPEIVIQLNENELF